MFEKWRQANKIRMLEVKPKKMIVLTTFEWVIDASCFFFIEREHFSLLFIHSQIITINKLARHSCLWVCVRVSMCSTIYGWVNFSVDYHFQHIYCSLLHYFFICALTFSISFKLYYFLFLIDVGYVFFSSLSLSLTPVFFGHINVGFEEEEVQPSRNTYINAHLFNYEWTKPKKYQLRRLDLYYI